MKAFFQQLFDYNYFCNKKLIEAFSGLKEIPPESARLFSHTLNAHHVWNARILGAETRYGVWDLHELQAWEDLHYENQRTSFEILTNTEHFEKRVEYENSEGKAFSNSLQDILFHIINHSTHHRSQIALDFRASGLEPLKLDYIFYKR